MRTFLEGLSQSLKESMPMIVSARMREADRKAQKKERKKEWKREDKLQDAKNKRAVLAAQAIALSKLEHPSAIDVKGSRVPEERGIGPSPEGVAKGHKEKILSGFGSGSKFDEIQFVAAPEPEGVLSGGGRVLMPERSLHETVGDMPVHKAAALSRELDVIKEIYNDKVEDNVKLVRGLAGYQASEPDPKRKAELGERIKSVLETYEDDPNVLEKLKAVMRGAEVEVGGRAASSAATAAATAARTEAERERQEVVSDLEAGFVSQGESGEEFTPNYDIVGILSLEAQERAHRRGARELAGTLSKDKREKGEQLKASQNKAQDSFGEFDPKGYILKAETRSELRDARVLPEARAMLHAAQLKVDGTERLSRGQINELTDIDEIDEARAKLNSLASQGPFLTPVQRALAIKATNEAMNNIVPFNPEENIKSMVGIGGVGGAIELFNVPQGRLAEFAFRASEWLPDVPLYYGGKEVSEETIEKGKGIVEEKEKEKEKEEGGGWRIRALPENDRPENQSK